MPYLAKTLELAEAQAEAYSNTWYEAYHIIPANDRYQKQGAQFLVVSTAELATSRTISRPVSKVKTYLNGLIY
tara:strand:+ start:884 stop:1102 length:219 start_codon:yes stop_codon:yes gene_type:complete